MVVTKLSIGRLHCNVAALLLEMVLDWKFLWQLSCFAYGFEILPFPYQDDLCQLSPSGFVAMLMHFLAYAI